MDLFVGVPFLSSVALFIVNIGALFIKQIQINQKVRHYFIGSVLMFWLSFAFGWKSAIEGFKQGMQDARNCCSEEVTAVDSLNAKEQELDTEQLSVFQKTD